MSGKHFDYEDQRLNYCIEQLKKDLKRDKKRMTDEYGGSYQFEHKETRKVAKQLIKKVKKVRQALHEYDWFVSGDTNEEFFLEKYKETYHKKDKKTDTVVHYPVTDTCEVKYE
jgi:thymidylate synthase